MQPSVVQLEAGVAPPEDDPAHESFLVMQTHCRSLIGLAIWWMKKYPKIQFVVTRCGQFAHNPSWGVYKTITFMLEHLWFHPYANHLGGPQCRSLELASPVKQPHNAEGEREWGLYYMVDSNLGDDTDPSMSGVFGFLAGACIDPICCRQHQKCGESHTSEAVAGGTALTHLTTTRGLTHELHVPQLLPTPAYFDSSTTIFCANDDAAVKRALWLRRRIAVLREGVEHFEFDPVKIDEADNCADMNTKYLEFKRWRRHGDWVSNLNDERKHAARNRRAALKLGGLASDVVDGVPVS